MTKLHRKAKEADPVNWDSTTWYQYLKSTSTTGLHAHLNKYHSKLYMVLAPQHSWKPLVSQSWTQALSRAEALQVEWPDEFTMEKFHKCLLNFIVADDQVEHLIFLYLPHSYFPVLNCPVSECCGVSWVQGASATPMTSSQRQFDPPSNKDIPTYSPSLEKVFY